MDKLILVLSVLVFVVHCATASPFTVHDSEEDVLPEMLRPIVRGGSWFDDMAVERLEQKHEKLEHDGKLDDHHHIEDSEEMFILNKLGLCKNGTKHMEHKKAEHVRPHVTSRGRVQTSISKSQSSEEEEKSHKEALNNMDNLPKNDKHRIHGPMTTEQFMALYEKELQGFFRKFMGVMSKAEIKGVNIERRSDSSKELPETGSRTNILHS